MSWLGGLFGKKDDESEAVRSLTHPSQLRAGDVIKLSFLDQQDLSAQRLEVTDVNTYDFDNKPYPSFTLKNDAGKVFFLSVEDDNGEEHLVISKVLKRNEVLSLFDEAAFSRVFNAGAGIKLNRRNDFPSKLEEWTAPMYAEEQDCTNGYYHEGDYRNRSLPQYEKDSCGLQYYLLEDPDENYAIEIEVYADGETEVSVAAYLPMTSVEEMWPGAKCL